MNYRHTAYALVLLAPFLASATAAAGQRPADDLFSVSFADERAGWVSGRWGTVLHTADGGQTWEKQNTGVDYTLASVSFADVRNGWAVGDEGTILHTSDGGKTWERQKSPVPYFLMGVQFVTKDKGWIVTERTHILHTEDGGRTWVIQHSDQDFILKAVSFCDAQTGWAVGEYGFIYHTTNGGKTWVRQAGEFGFSEETGEVVGGSALFDVAAVSPSTAWVVGIDGYVALTTDGGKSWLKRMNGVPKTHLFGVVASDREVVVAGDATLLMTTDQGKTWLRADAQPSIRYGWLYRIGARRTGGFVAVGQGGWIYRATPEDRSWKLAKY